MAVSGARQRFTHFLSEAKRCRSRPRPPVPASQVPILFREPYILSGYRPVGQAWSCYVLSLFQRHNESVNVWTHLLAAAALLLRWGAEPPWPAGPPGAPGPPEQPLGLYVGSALCYLCCSVAAHLLQSRSELAHYCLFFLDYVGVAVYQYGCALGHYFYGSEAAWRAGPPGPAFLPGAALLAWLSCATCCFAKSYWRRPYPPARRVCTLIPAGLAYLLISSPLLHRLGAAGGPWGPGLRLHAAHMALFLLSVLFFSCPVPERFLPGRCDFLGQGHQVFHVLLALCSFAQLEALLVDARRQGAGPGAFGEEEVLRACLLLPLVAGCCLLTALLAGRHKHRQLLAESGGGGGKGR